MCDDAVGWIWMNNQNFVDIVDEMEATAAGRGKNSHAAAPD